MGFLETLGRSGFDPAQSLNSGLTIRNNVDAIRKRQAQEKRDNELIDASAQGFPPEAIELLRKASPQDFSNGTMVKRGAWARLVSSVAENKKQLDPILKTFENKARIKVQNLRKLGDDLEIKGGDPDKIAQFRQREADANRELENTFNITAEHRSKEQQNKLTSGRGILAAEEIIGDDNNDPILASTKASGNLTGFNQRLRQQETDAAALAKEERAAGKGSKLTGGEQSTIEKLERGKRRLKKEFDLSDDDEVIKALNRKISEVTKSDNLVGDKDIISIRNTISDNARQQVGDEIKLQFGGEGIVFDESGQVDFLATMSQLQKSNPEAAQFYLKRLSELQQQGLQGLTPDISKRVGAGFKEIEQDPVFTTPEEPSSTINEILRGDEKNSFDELPNPAKFKGKTIKDNETGRRFKSDGKKWNEIK